ncbi:MAG TPA: hypothetical protein VI542_15160 [Candidatus Tectomicrobia bacterium]
MAASHSGGDLEGSNAALVYRDLPVGARVRRKDGAVLEVTGNPGDGAWLLVRVVENANDPARVGEEDMVFFTDVEAVVS